MTDTTDTNIDPAADPAANTAGPETPADHDETVKNPAGLLAKNKLLLAKNAELTARIAELEGLLTQAQESEGAAVQARDAAVFDFYGLTPFRNAIAKLESPTPKLMEEVILKLCDLRLDAENKPYLVDKKTGEEITTSEIVDDPSRRGKPLKSLPPREYKHTRVDPGDSDSLARWICDNGSKTYEGIDNPYHLLPRAVGSGGTGSGPSIYSSIAARAPTPAPASPKPTLGLR